MHAFMPRSATTSRPLLRPAGVWSPEWSPRPFRAATATANSSSQPSAAEPRLLHLSVAIASAMVPRDDIARKHHRGRSGAGACGLARRDHRNGQTGMAHDADPTRSDRHDDDRPGAHWAARRRCHSCRRPRAPDPVRRIRAWDGTGFCSHTTGGAGVRCTRTADGPPLAAGGTLGRADAWHSRECRTALGRGHSHYGRAIICQAALRARYLTGLAGVIIPTWWVMTVGTF